MHSLRRVLALSVCLLAAHASASSQIRIYFVPWYVESMREMTVDDVRSSAWVKTELGSFVADEFIEIIRDVRISDKAMPRSADVRLVVDIIEADRVTETYYASEHFLFSDRLGAAGQIDEDFRRRFTALWEKKKGRK